MSFEKSPKPAYITTVPDGTANTTGALFGSTSSGDLPTPVAVGWGALKSNAVVTSPASAGSQNTAVGVNSLTANVSGSGNTAVGNNTLEGNVYASYNTAIGGYSLYANTMGNSNTAVGFASLLNNNTGVSNVALGTSSSNAITTGGSNTAVGALSLTSNQSGNGNVAIGQAALFDVTGSYNVGIGYHAGTSSTGSERLFINGSNYSDPLIYGEFDNQKLSINGSLKLVQATREKIYSTSTGFAGYTYYFVTNGAIQYITANSTSNGTVNILPSSGNLTDYYLGTAESITIVLQVTNGATAYYPTAWQIDGGNVTPKWSGGTAPTGGNANAIDVYTLTIEKTSTNPAQYTVLASQTKFA